MKSFLRQFATDLEKGILKIVGEYAGHRDIKLVFTLTKRRHLGKIMIVDRFTGRKRKLHHGSWGTVYDWEKMRQCLVVKDCLEMVISTLQHFPGINDCDPKALKYLKQFVKIVGVTRTENCLEDYSLCFVSQVHRYRIIPCCTTP